MGTDKYDDDIKVAVGKWWPDLPTWKLWKAQLFQESHLDPTAKSGVGALGLAQFMPSSWRGVALALKYPEGVSPADARYAIDAGAYYQGRLRRSWSATGRSPVQRNDLGQASYNAGLGSILKAQERCHGAVLWEAIVPCLSDVTGPQNMTQTKGYVTNIHRWWQIMESDK